MKKRIIIGIIILIITTLIVILGYLKNKQRVKTPNAVEISQQQQPSPLPVTEITETLSPATETLTLTTTVPTTTKPYQLLFNQPFLYLDLDYPLLYVYDPKQEVIKYLNLEDETYKEIAKVSNLKNAWLSEDKTKIVIENDKGFSLLDLKTDSLYQLPALTKKVILATDIFLYLSDDKKISYLASFKNGKITKMRDLGILAPDFVVLKNGLLLYETNSPVFLFDFKNPAILKLFLEAKNDYSLLTNKNKDLLFINFKENNIWQSEVIDLNKKVKYSFSWATIKDKCSFDDILVCALPADLKNFSPEDWYLLKPNFDEKIILYDPKNDQVKEVNLEAKFDFIRPKFTPLGIIAWNRLDAKFYLLKLE